MSTLTSPLLRRTTLLPGESLSSFLMRVARCNYYEPPGILHRLCREVLKESGDEDDLGSPTRTETYEVLEVLTKVEPKDIYSATPHSFARVLTWRDSQIRFLKLPGSGAVPLAQRTPGRHLRPDYLAQFCPQCLSESAYHRLIWVPAAVASCLQHQCLLVDHCPECESMVSVRSIVEAKCSRCEFQLIKSPLTQVEKTAFGFSAQSFLQSWFGLAVRSTALSSCALPVTAPQFLYELVDGLRFSIRRFYRDWDYSEMIPAGSGRTVCPDRRGEIRPSSENYCLFATAFKAIANWPKGLYQFLDAYRRRHNPGGNIALYPDLGVIYEKLEYEWRDEGFRFVQDAFDEYLVENYPLSSSIARSHRQERNPISEERFAYVSIDRAAELLGTSTEMINRLAQVGRLQHHTFHEFKKTSHCCVRRAEVLDLRREWDNCISLEEASQFLGLSRDVVVDLTEVGLLVAERGPNADRSSQWLFGRQSLQQCFDSIASKIIDDHNSFEPTIDLTRAAQILFVVGLNVAGILKRIVDGKLLGFSSEGDLALGKIHFSEEHLRECAIAVKIENLWKTRRDVARAMGVKHTVVSRWVNADLLSPVASFGNADYFDQESVVKFKSDYLFTETAAQILQVGPVSVLRWARTGRLKAVSGPKIDGGHRYLFRSEEVERLRAENRLTGPQMAGILGISRTRLGQWIKKGKVKPISGPGIDGNPHYLFERTQGIRDLSPARIHRLHFKRKRKNHELERMFPGFSEADAGNALDTITPDK